MYVPGDGGGDALNQMQEGWPILPIWPRPHRFIPRQRNAGEHPGSGVSSLAGSSLGLRPSKTSKARADLKAKKRKAIARDAALTSRAKAAAATFVVGPAAGEMATLDAATFFARLDNYPRFVRSHAMERRGRRDLFVAVYELIVSLGDRINSEAFIAIAKAQGRELKGANLDPAAVILRRGMRYDERWQGLPEAEQAQERKAALKLFSQDFAAMRWVLSKHYPVSEVRRRLTSKGDGVKSWEKAWRRREDGDRGQSATPQKANPAPVAATPSRPMRDVEPDIDWLVDQAMAAIDGRLPLDFEVDLKQGHLFFIQVRRDPSGKAELTGARRLGVASRFEGKVGRKRFRQALESLKRPTGSAR